MILKASTRGNAAELARHLLRLDENDHVDLHDLRGVTTDDLSSAFKEMTYVAKGTRCAKFLFSLSLNPPQDAIVPIKVFEKAVAQIEGDLGLTAQPRAIVFHEKNGRRHAHVVWSRIDVETMTALQMRYYKTKLQAISRQMYLEQGWDLPSGLRGKPSNPLNYSLAEWQMAKRRGVCPKAQKADIQEAWAASDTAESFAAALAEHGYRLARGDRRGFVLLCPDGAVMSLPRALGKTTKEVRARLGEAEDLPSLSEAIAALKSDVRANFGRMARGVRNELSEQTAEIDKQRKEMAMEHRRQRRAFDLEQRKRREEEVLRRAARLHKGLRGLWQRVTGAHGRVVRQNEAEARVAAARDQRERQALIQEQLAVSRALAEKRQAAVEKVRAQLAEMRKDRDSIWSKLDQGAEPRPKRRRKQPRPEQGPEPEM